MPHLGIRRRLQALRDLRYWFVLRRLDHNRPVEYRAYLEGQLRRSLSKRATDPGVGAASLVKSVARSAGRGASVLCIGCRNGYELDRFRRHGLEPVGIDLFSQRHDILVMDMHEMLFPDDSFDAVYASHSLEHSHDLPAVLGEIGRVARDGAIIGVEVPVRHKGSDADLIEFSGLDEFKDALRPLALDVLSEEEQPPHSPSNAQGSDIARLVFRLEKPAATTAPARAPVRARRTWARAGATIAAVGAVAFFVFGVLPELLGDWPYNAYGKNTAHAHHQPAPARPSHTRVALADDA